MLRQVRRLLVPLLLALATGAAHAGTLVDDLAPAIRGGHLALELALRPGSVAINPAWSLQAAGAPVASVTVDAEDGNVTTLAIRVRDGELVLVGKGLRPDIVLSAVDADATGTITSAQFHGKGLGRPVVALFRGLAMKAVRRVRFHTAIAQLLRGNLVASSEGAPRTTSAATSAAAAAPAPGTTAPATPPPPAPAGPGAADFLALVDEVRLDGTHLTAFAGRRMAFGAVLAFSAADGDPPFRLGIDSLRFRPAHGEAPATYRVTGRVDGRLGTGEMAWRGDRFAFASGTLEGGHFEVASGSPAVVHADRLALTLAEGHFRSPIGVDVDLGPGSAFEARRVGWANGKLSAVVDLDLAGKTGTFSHQGSHLAIQDGRIRTRGLTIEGDRTNGVVELDFDYRLVHTLTVKYPMPGLDERRVPLEFRGPFSARIRVENVGSADGRAEGEYRFRAPWPPVEKAAFEVLRARWQQEVPGMRKVAFDLEPVRFVPCGGDCFLARFRIRAEKQISRGRHLTLDCVPEGSASLVVDKAARTFLLRGVKIRPQCKGLLGKVVDLIAPLVTKSYEDLVLFKLADDSPFTIDSVRSEEEWVEIAGSLSWAAPVTR